MRHDLQEASRGGLLRHVNRFCAPAAVGEPWYFGSYLLISMCLCMLISIPCLLLKFTHIRANSCSPKRMGYSDSSQGVLRARIQGIRDDQDEANR
jgi:hypothetical protein